MASIWKREKKVPPSENVPDITITSTATSTSAPMPSEGRSTPKTIPGVPEIRPSSVGSDDLTLDLMRLIGSAIDEWSRRHGLENMPRDIVFEQALLALNEVQRAADQRGQKEH
ncbi:hypothetical protein [Terrabacter sp. C0L_2]|uniref:hypothetical protein n=1 Tax=Terrabacter sp. C0L_2 TaxID=3108389 RepID=UPI002ED61D6C|nr:hypothetical protein U5C87_00675 [Terrabacter sp. C0L_2]